MRQKLSLLTKTMLLLLVLVAGSGNAWAVSKPWTGDDPASTLDLQTITSSTMGTWNDEISWYLDDDYLIVSGYESYKSVANQTWITQSSVGSSNIAWGASSPFKGSSYYTNGSYATIQSGRYLLYKVTNLKSLKVYGKNNSTTKYLDIFIYTKSGNNNYTKVEEIKYTTDNSEHIWENSTTLSPSETYFIYITGVGGSNSRVFEVAFERNVSVTKYSLSSNVTPASSGSVILGSTSLSEGSTTTISATPAEGYRFVNWTVSGTGASVGSLTTASTTFTMGTADATVTATFETIPSHTLSSAITPTGAGTVLLGATSLIEGASTTITANANSGYKFTGWSISGTGATLGSTTDNPTTMTMGTADATVTATFEAVTTYAIKWSVNGEVKKTENVEANTAINFPTTIEGVPAGYVLKGWVTEANKIVGTTDTEPSANYVTSATSTADITYYAVMSIKTGTGPDTYEQLGSNNFDATATYVIGAAQSSTVATMWYLKSYSKVDANSDWGVMTSSPADNTPITFTLSGTASALVAKDNSGRYLAGLTTGKFRMQSTSTTIKLGNSGEIQNSSDNSYKLRHNYNGGNGGLRWYSGDTGTLAYFYKVIPGETYSFCTTVPTMTITLDSRCTDGTKYYGTFSSSSAFEVADGLTVSEISVTGGVLSLTDYAKGEIVPANTGVLVAAESAGDKTVNMTVGGTSKLGDDNMLKASGDAGIDAATMGAGAADGTKFYRLTMHDGKDIGFWWGAADGAAFDLDANKAYLAVPNATAARLQGLWFGEVHGIEALLISGKEMNSNVYDLQGRRVAQPTKGLYIVNGKKVIIK